MNLPSPLRTAALCLLVFYAAFLSACATPTPVAPAPVASAPASQLDDQPVEKSSALAPTPAPLVTATRPTLWIIGDSTVKVGTAGQRGWGEEIAPFFDPAKINVVNRAIGGRSSRTFITEGRWDGILGEICPGDFVIMQFGHNDSSPINEDPPVTKSTRARGTIRGNGDETVFVEKNILTEKPETVHSYGWYLRHYISTAKDKGVVVSIVCSPIPRKSSSSRVLGYALPEYWTGHGSLLAVEGGETP